MREALNDPRDFPKVEDKAKFIDGNMARKATIKSIEFPDLTVAIVGNNAIVRPQRQIKI